MQQKDIFEMNCFSIKTGHEIEKDVHIHDPSEPQNVNVIYIRECIIGNYTDVFLRMSSLFVAWLFQQKECAAKIFRADTPSLISPFKLYSSLERTYTILFVLHTHFQSKVHSNCLL